MPPGPRRPLAETLAALPPGTPAVVPGAPTGDGWVAAAELFGSTRLDGLLARVHRQVVALVPPQRRRDVPATVAPAYLLEWYLRGVSAAAARPFVHARRVPSLDPPAVRLRLAPEGWPVAVALAAPTFACLPDDLDADHPDARPVAGLSGLRAALRAEVAGHAEGFLAAWGRRGRRGRRALWATATDALAEAVQTAAPGGRGAGEVAALLCDRPGRELGPFVAGIRFPGAVHPGAAGEPLRSRVSCCFAYAVPGAQACFSCPRTDGDERTRRPAATRAAS